MGIFLWQLSKSLLKERWMTFRVAKWLVCQVYTTIKLIFVAYQHTGEMIINVETVWSVECLARIRLASPRIASASASEASGVSFCESSVWRTLNVWSQRTSHLSRKRTHGTNTEIGLRFWRIQWALLAQRLWLCPWALRDNEDPSMFASIKLIVLIWNLRLYKGTWISRLLSASSSKTFHL